MPAKGSPEPRSWGPRGVGARAAADPGLIPPEWIEDSVEFLLAEHGSGSSGLYAVLLVMVCGTLAALPVVRVPVGVSGEGIIRPELERHEVRTAAAGVVEEVFTGEDLVVSAGDPLVRIRLIGAAERAAALESERARLLAEVSDLERLVGRAEPAGPPRLSVPRYRTAQERHRRVLRQHADRIDHLERETRRIRALVERDVLPLSELEQAAFRLEQERGAAEIYAADARSAWEAQLAEAHSMLERLAAEQAGLRAELSLGILRAPIDGTLEQLAPVSAGSVVQAGDVVAVISPDTTLVAVSHVDARVAALIGPGAPVRLEVEAYPSSEWGIATGRVRRVAADAVPIDGRPVYAVLVDLDTPGLRNRQGHPGELRKGMPFRARFTPDRRTLWQLLRDDLGDRFDPTGSDG